MHAKAPGDRLVAAPVDLEVTERTLVSEGADAYERLIADAIDGDPRLFARGDTVEASWRVVEPVLAAPPPVISYPRGSWGPARADDLVHEHHGWTDCSDGHRTRPE